MAVSWARHRQNRIELAETRRTRPSKVDVDRTVTDRQTERETETDRQKERQTDRLTDRETEKQRDRDRDRDGHRPVVSTRVPRT